MANARSIESNPDLLDIDADFGTHAELASGPAVRRTAAGTMFWSSKRMADVVLSGVLLPVVGIIAVFVAAANVVFNPGPVFFTQQRMGRNCRPFTIYKFRTMLPARQMCRGPEDPVELDRITPFGAFLRRTRIDELPQLWNVVRGDMSLIGPRPDMYEHAEQYLQTVPFYRRRYAVRPGISGLAQVTAGYAEGSEGTIEKARRDAIYIRRACWRLELFIVAQTLAVILSGKGSK